MYEEFGHSERLRYHDGRSHWKNQEMRMRRRIVFNIVYQLHQLKLKERQRTHFTNPNPISAINLPFIYRLHLAHLHQITTFGPLSFCRMQGDLRCMISLEEKGAGWVKSEFGGHRNFSVNHPLSLDQCPSKPAAYVGCLMVAILIKS